MRLQAVVALVLLLAASAASGQRPASIVLAAPGASSLLITFNDGNEIRITATSTGISTASSAIDDISGCGLSSGVMVCSMSGEDGGVALANMTLDLSTVVKTIECNPGAAIPSGEEWTQATTAGGHQVAFVSDPDNSDDIVVLAFGGGTTVTRKTALFDFFGAFVKCDSVPSDCEDVLIEDVWDIGDWFEWFLVGNPPSLPPVWW